MRVKYLHRFMVALVLLATSAVLAYGQASSFHVLVDRQASGFLFSVQDEDVTSARVEVARMDGRRVFDSGWILDRSVSWPLTAPTE